ncbi:MAG: insulinase family protein [Bacteroidetes bacterium]|nr:insulinase family protein [Bacteroidota bacterium]
MIDRKHRLFVRKPERIGPPARNSVAKWQLGNGLNVVASRMEGLKSVTLGIWVLTGSRCEETATAGLTHFIEHTVFKGTKKRTSLGIARSLESVGGNLNAFTSKEHTCYYASVLSEHLDLALDVLSDLVRSASFESREVEKEKLVILEEIRDSEDNPEEYVQDLNYEQLFPSHPLGFPILGSPDTVMRITNRLVRDTYRRRYRPTNMVLSVAGGFEETELRHLTSKWFGRHAEGRRSSWHRQFKPPPTRSRKGSRKVVEKKILQSHVSMGLRLPIHYRNSKKFDVLAYNLILGGGMSSRLFQRIRERHGVAYSIYSFTDFLYDTGVLGVYLATEKNKTEKAERMVRAEILRLGERGALTSELKMAKAQMTANLLFGLESTSTQMIRIAKNEIYLKKSVDMSVLTDYINSISLSDIRQIAEYVANHLHIVETSVIT